MSDRYVDLLHGQKAHALLDDGFFVELWRKLYEQCPHATAFQGPNFVRTWYKTYREQWQPVILLWRHSDEELAGLWMLAYNISAKELSHAGTIQSEYQAWLALPGKDIPFLSAAWEEIKRCFAFAALRFIYLPAASLGGILQAVPSMKNCVAVRKQSRPLLPLTPEGIKESFSKKSNKSRFNRLKKLGSLEFRRITDPAELDRMFSDMIMYYDFRQTSVSHIAPFQADPLKRIFHMNLFAGSPAENYVTAAYLNERLISAFWGAVSGRVVHLGMLVFSPFVAEHSPGKLHIMQLSELLLRDEKTLLDLTPGGCTWKERFADAHDEVAEAVIYSSASVKMRDDVLHEFLHLGKRCASGVGIPVATVKAAVSCLRDFRPARVVQKMKNRHGQSRQLCVYRCNRARAETFQCDGDLNCNSITDLFLFEAVRADEDRDAFLSEALARLEHGQFVYTARANNRLAFCGWMTKTTTAFPAGEVGQSLPLPPGSVALRDFYSHPDLHDAGCFESAIRRMVCEAFASEGVSEAYIFLQPDVLDIRQAIESLGFEHIRTLALKSASE
ncbi:MAG TPA: GNAT family N-acetyltransferase [Dissulfurispiraceae bacterium]|nr:GNAT family N-acetyltransferase [Dissulfurispiraceae bacterium]